MPLFSYCESSSQILNPSVEFTACEYVRLHTYPSLPMPTLLLSGFRKPPKQGAAVARVLTTRDVAIESCHDGPLELQLMERLDRMFPEEEEIRSYDPELDVPISTTDGPRKPPKPPNALIA
ncbi:hypothetical protein DL93DRAFT_512103 [Clavulina sp. PMI_390]|nr:hypothetical protein DL93DRAFT_512103 [Clavulina sp. PMI_390]